MPYTICQPFIARALKPEEKREATKPFLRWVGGKQRLVGSLLERLPHEINTYYEPFLGGGSLFFALHRHFRKAVISDINARLINAYEGVRDAPDEVHVLLTKHAANLNTRGQVYYYEQRAALNQAGPHRHDIAQAARFIFLIHSNFNGIHRENRKGEYNVPFGKKDPCLPSLEHLRMASQFLLECRQVEIHNFGYDSILDRVEKNDFVYLDPPYPVLNNTAKFTQYTKDAFSVPEQERLAIHAKAMAARHANVMVSIADLGWVRDLYAGWNFHGTTLQRTVSSKAPRMYAQELIITSY